MDLKQAASPSMNSLRATNLSAFSSKKMGKSTHPVEFPPLSSGVRVQVDDVAAEPLDFPTKKGLEHALSTRKSASACSHMDTRFVHARLDTHNALLKAAVLAFKNHHPLEISPDAIFSTIMAGVSAHVNANPERFRRVIVAHEGKKELAVQDDSLVMGSWENRWDRMVAQLGEMVMLNLSNETACQVLMTGFTTTGPAQSASHTMTFMDVVKAYFDYVCVTRCGIPHIDIAGCQQDWEKLAAVISPLLVQLDLSEWNEQLQAILGQFVAAFEGKAEANREFWQGMIKYNGPAGSGGAANVTGWLSQLFPYLDGDVSPAVNITGGVKAKAYRSFFEQDDTSISAHPRIALSSFPTSVTTTPFTWDYFGKDKKMELVAGIIGITAGESGALKPEVGWLVAYANDKP